MDMKFGEIVRSYTAKRRAVRELNQMDERSLNDIGLRREQISHAVWGR
jgi:uncharacterized protein YjiS (DUF1127 family)